MDKPQVLQGFRDYLPHDMRTRQQLVDKVRQVYERYGFEPLDTPALEYAETLLGKYGDEEKLIYHFKDQGDREVALRYDLTVPLARVIASHPELPKPFKRYQSALAWRAESPQRGRFREFMQFDVDTVGSSSPMADAEIILTMIDTMESLSLPDFIIRLNHRGVMNALLNHLEIKKDQMIPVMRTIDKVDKIGMPKAKDILAEIITMSKADRLLDILFNEGDSERMIDSLTSELEADKAGMEALANLVDIVGLIGSKKKDKYRIDLSIVRGLDYYTGLVYETNLLSNQSLGSVFSGGRYDQLMLKLAGIDLPAVGTSLGVDRLMTVLTERKMTCEKELFCLLVFPGLERETFELASELRAAGLQIIVPLTEGRIGKQLQYADNVGAGVSLIYGEDEISKGVLVARNMQSGEQKSISLKPKDTLISNLKSLGERK